MKRAVIEASVALRQAIDHFEQLETEAIKKHSVALHEIRKLNRTVKQAAERLCSRTENPDAELVKIWKSADMMSQQFDVIEVLANESLMQLPVSSECDLYPLFDKCVRIYTPVDAPGRITLRAFPYGYSGPVMACDKTIMILPTVLIENALKYATQRDSINVTIERRSGWIVVRVRNLSRRSMPLTQKCVSEGRPTVG
ncbi:MAG: hypothetical protein U1A77_24055 [Pirellulales bacterium]